MTKVVCYDDGVCNVDVLKIVSFCLERDIESRFGSHTPRSYYIEFVPMHYGTCYTLKKFYVIGLDGYCEGIGGYMDMDRLLSAIDLDIKKEEEE